MRDLDLATQRLWHPRPMVKVSVLAAAVLFASGCGTGVASRPIVEFPTQDYLASVEARPVTLPPLQTAEVPPEGWSVEPVGYPTDPTDGLWTPRGAWEKAFASAYSAVGHSSGLTRAMACAAREMGRFYLEKHAQPPEALRQFMTAACGVFGPSVGFQLLEDTVSEEDGDDELLARWQHQIFSGLVARLPAEAKYVGFWFGRAHGRAVALAAFDAAPVELQALSPVPDANGDLTIERARPRAGREIGAGQRAPGVAG
jgi:hypothetical protein